MCPVALARNSRVTSGLALFLLPPLPPLSHAIDHQIWSEIVSKPNFPFSPSYFSPLPGTAKWPSTWFWPKGCLESYHPPALKFLRTKLELLVWPWRPCTTWHTETAQLGLCPLLSKNRVPYILVELF